MAKVGEYLAAGVKAVWVADPDDRTVAVHTPGSRGGTGPSPRNPASAVASTRSRSGSGLRSSPRSGAASPAVVQQVANVLRVEGYPFVVHTPAGSVRLASEKSGNDYVELRLEEQ